MKKSKKKSKSSYPFSKVHTSMNIKDIKQALAENLFFVQAKPLMTVTPHDCYMAVAYTVRDRMMKRWVDSVETFFTKDKKAVAYLSAEFLMGPQLGSNLLSLGIYDLMERAVKEYGLDLNELIEEEVEPGLGNGGLGRLAACYLDSLATLEMPAIGYGIRYEFGIFKQKIVIIS